ncbi:tubulin binding cofactor C-domain-containing protein [Dactylonectria macrodidyma]|uniref:Tubulin binding cofactor C-domain-containing protein n=1 Tax=Dactylonectria macrodidyma TaxID=307937 RepID=A0A9P9JAJ1_9HYPO|nr:tubulin binding cofactor C-domain-containing protein [Dactylonectria macrodidyma]
MSIMEAQTQAPTQWSATHPFLFRRKSTMDPKQRFYNHFTESVSGLQDLVDELPSIANVGGERQEAIDHILAAIAKLQNEVSDAADFTPSYDRKQYSETIKALQDKLNETIAKITPKSRFQFRRTNTPHVDMGAPENDPRLNPGSFSRKNTLPIAETIPEPPKEDTLSDLPTKVKNYNEEMARPSNSPLRKPSFSAAKTIGISNHSGLHIILPSSAARATASGSLTELSGCIVDMSIPTVHGAPFPGLAIKNISKSFIVAGRVNGPVHITGVSDSILVIVSRQVRIHECSNVDIYLHCGSHPIIEDCSGMRFAPLPDVYVTEADKDTENQWDQVDDFKWLKADHSPNWATLPEEERLADELWRKVVPGQPGTSVEETLKKLGIPRR